MFKTVTPLTPLNLLKILSKGPNPPINPLKGPFAVHFMLWLVAPAQLQALKGLTGRAPY